MTDAYRRHHILYDPLVKDLRERLSVIEGMSVHGQADKADHLWDAVKRTLEAPQVQAMSDGDLERLVAETDPSDLEHRLQELRGE